jgi:hypothetical protein
MPTTLPDMAVRARHQRRQLLAELIPIAAVIVYLFLLAWNAVTLEANLGWLFEPADRQDQSHDRYNPMEPGHGAPNRANRSNTWLARAPDRD